MKIAIVTDSSAEISKEEAQRLGIYIVRMPLTVGGVEYIEETTITRNNLIQAMLEGKHVSTSQPNLHETTEFFNSILKDYEHIIYLPISSRLSGAYESSLMLLDEFKENLTIIDTKFVSWPLLWMSLEAKRFAENGMTPTTIKTMLEEDSFMYASLIPSDIQYLKRGGRIKPAAAAVANLLKIVPVLKVTEGEIDLAEKVRTHKKAVMVGFENVINHGQPYEDYEWAVLDGGCEQSLFEEMVEKLEERIKCKVHRGKLYPIVLAHTGPGTIALVAVKRFKEAL